MKRLWWLMMVIGLFACDTAEQSDIPYSNVYFKVDLRFEDKVLNAQLASKVFTTPRYAGEALGYCGILVVHGLNDIFYAFEISYKEHKDEEMSQEVLEKYNWYYLNVFIFNS